jgi:hypothetical protein
MQYTTPLKIEKSCELKAISCVKGKICSNAASFSLSKAKYSIDLNSGVSQKYSASGAKTLVDGKTGSGKFTDGKWLGFEGIDFEAIVNLGTIKPLRSVSVSFLQSHNSWIFLPLSVEVYTSDDNIQFSPAGVAFGETLSGYGGDRRAVYKVFSNKNAQFLKIKVKNTGICPYWHKGYPGKAWLFIDEIEVN